MLEPLVNALMLLWAGLPVLAWLVRLLLPKRIHVVILYIATVVVGYFVFVGCAWTADVLLEERMNSFDLDGDGGISGDERTPEAEKAMDDWASDTGRTLAIFTALPLSAIWAAVWLTPLCIGEWIFRRLTGRQIPKVEQTVVMDRPSDDGNPYQSPGGG